MIARVVRWDGDGLNDQVSQETGLKCKDPSLARQSERDSADINFILRRYEKTGALPDMIAREPIFGDFSDAPSFQEALEVVSKAELQFAALDAPIRYRFHNDPAAFLAFATDPANLDEMRRMGLCKPEAKPVEGQVATPPSQPAPGAVDAPKTPGAVDAPKK